MLRLAVLLVPNLSADGLSERQGHFDGVIKRYREMHVTAWPDDMPEVIPLLERLGRIHPNQDTQTHILHLASDGVILVGRLCVIGAGITFPNTPASPQPHVDNVEASGCVLPSSGSCLY